MSLSCAAPTRVAEAKSKGQVVAAQPLRSRGARAGSARRPDNATRRINLNLQLLPDLISGFSS